MIIYAIIITLRGKANRDIAALREQYNKYVHYSIVPHITLLYPVVLKSGLSDLFSILDRVASQTKPFFIDLRGVCYFEGRNNVAYVALEDRQPVIYLSNNINHSLRGEIINNNDQINTYGDFTPHVTITELVPVDIFPNIKMELAKLGLKYRVRIDSFCLFSTQQNTTWEVWKRERVFKLG